MSARGAAAGTRGSGRGPVTWYAYLLLGFFTFLLNIQGNIGPFLKAELALSWRLVSLHSSAIAAGMIVVGLYGERVARRLGRRRTLRLGAGGAAAGAVLLCAAPSVWASLASCALIGVLGGLIPSLVPAILAQRHGARRDIALSEATAVSYAFAILAPLLMSLCLALALGWRAAVLAGAALGAAIVLGFAAAVPDDPAPAEPGGGALPAAYWAYWCLLGVVVAVEFCVLLWAPAFLEQEVGLARPAAAAAAAAFALAMLLGRTAGSGLVRKVAPPRLFPLALMMTGLGFFIYWSSAGYWSGAGPAVAVGGLFVLGLGVALLYPLTLGFAIGTAGRQGDAASARVMTAVGLAVLSMPVLLGGLADGIGLRLAHLVLPALVLLALACFAIARRLPQPAPA